jgi:3-deoxy-D-manno-octulosonic-acid transferase
MLALGLSSKRVLVSGNVKFDFDLSVGEQTEYFKERFDLESKRPLIIAASTHAPEEYILIEALKKTFVYHDGLHPRLLIAPRHPERFNEVASMLMTSGLIWVRRSEPLCVEDKTCDVVLLDTIGEIRSVYQLAELVFVGGSIANKGGHNILEPAAAARCTITGAHTYNFSAIVNSFLKSDAVIQLPSLTETEAIEALSKLFAELLTDDHRRNSIGFRAKTVLENNNGASFRTVKMLAPLLTFDELPSKRPAA